MTKLEKKVLYLATHLGADLRFQDKTRYTMKSGQFTDVLHKGEPYSVSPIILSIMQEEGNERVIQRAYLILKDISNVDKEEMNQWLDHYTVEDLKNVFRSEGYYTGEFLGIDPIKEGWVILEK